MAKRKQSATTVRSAGATARRTPFGNTAIRLFGAILTFVGLILILTKTSSFSTFLTVFSVGCMVAGLFVAISNLKKMIHSSSSTGDVMLYFFVGLLVLIAGILFYVFRSQLQKWFIVIIGAVAAAYGLGMLIRASMYKTKNLVLNVIIACLTIIAGILIALLVVPEIASASKGICYYIFGCIAAAVGTLELIIY